MIKSRSFIAALAAGTIVIAGCSAGSTDYKKAAEKAFTDASGEGSTAVCDTPAATSVGTTFKCTGTGADGTKFDLVATIDKANHVLVNSAGAATDTSTPAGGSTTETTVAGTPDSTATTIADATPTT
jgi:hypothetical protein